MKVLRKKQLILVGVIASIAIAGWLSFRNNGQGEAVEVISSVAPPTCSIRFLTHEERLKPEPIWRHILDSHEAEWPYPPEQVDNPVLFRNRYARVRFENTTGRVLVAYFHGGSSTEEESRAQAERQRDQIRHIRGIGVKQRAYLLSLIENPPAARATIFPCVVEEAIFGADGKEIEVVELYQSQQFGGRVPSATEIHANGYQTVSLQPGESVEFRMSILAKLIRPSVGLKPGTYTVRATVSYAEAPSGETKRVTSEPVTITVTEEHIKAAEAYWAAANK